jgi:hypothetical protein
MSDTTGAPEATWRDLADMLTDEQAGELGELEEFNLPSGQPGLLRGAASMAYDNVLATRYAEVPEPPDAIKVSQWCDLDDVLDEDDIGAHRHFTTATPATWAVEADGQEHGYQVGISGFQFPDGSARRWVTLAAPDNGSTHSTPTPRQSRQLGAALIAAADKCDEYASREEVTE